MWSPSASRMFGWTESEVLGRFLPIVPEEHRQEVYDRIERDLKGESISPLDVRRVRKDGSLVDTNLWSAPLRDSKGEVIGILGLYADITARKRAEEAVQESEMELRRVLAAVSDCIYSGEFDSDGRFFYHYYSPAAERILGRSPLFFLAGRERWLSAVHAEDRPRLAQAFARLRTGQWAFAEEEYRIVLPDGTIRWVRDSVTLSQETDGRRFVNGVVSDITARKQAEETLQQAQAELQRVLATVSDYIWSGQFDSDGRFSYRYNSPAVERILGRPAEFFRAGRGRWLSILHPEDRPRAAQAIDRLLTGQSASEDEEYRIVLPDGAIRWVRNSVTISQSPAGLRCLNGVVTDITARKQSEEALRESEERYRLMAEAIPQLVWRTNDRGETTECNGRWYEYTGQTPEETRGNGWMKALHPDDAGRVMQKVKSDVAGGDIYQAEYRLRRASDGSYRWHVARALPIKNKDGRIVCWFGCAADIDDQKRAQEMLEQRVRQRTAELAEANVAMRLQSTALEAAANGIVVYDREGHVVWVNPAFTELTGYELSEVIGKDLRVLKSGQHDETFYQNLWQTVRSGQVWHGELVNKRKDGNLYTEELTITPVRDAAGEISHFIAIKQDITERKSAEKSRRHLAAIVEYSDDAITSGDPDGTITSWNAGAQRLYNYAAEEILGRPVSVLVPRNRRGEAERFRKKVLCGEHIQHYETVRLGKGGFPVDVSITVSPIKNDRGQVTGVSAITRDITERKRAEEALQKSEAQYRALVETTDTGFVIIDSKGRVLDANAEYVRLTGHRDLDQIRGRRVVEWTAAADKKRNAQAVRTCLKNGYIRNLEIGHVDSHGKVTPIEINATVEKTQGTLRIVALCRDITERKGLEQAVIEASSREQRIIGQNLHDGVCQQLAGISFLWRTVAQSVVARGLPEAATAAEIGQLITKTICEARDLAHVLCPVELERNDLGVALKNLGLSMERLFAISCVVRCQQPVRLADKTVATHLYRIAQETISNAIHHGKAARVWIHLGWKKNSLTLRIRDSGSGFSKGRGFKEGIGMRSMKYRAQAIGGSLSIESKRGAGATVACVYTQPRSRFAGEARRHTPG